MKKEVLKNSFVFGIILILIFLIVSSIISFIIKLLGFSLSDLITKFWINLFVLCFGIWIIVIIYVRLYYELPSKLFKIKIAFIYSIYSVSLYFFLLFLYLIAGRILLPPTLIFNLVVLALHLPQGFLVYWLIGYESKRVYLKIKSKQKVNLVDINQSREEVSYASKESRGTLFVLIGLFLFVSFAGIFLLNYNSEKIIQFGQELRTDPSAMSDIRNYTLERKLLDATPYYHKIKLDIPSNWEENFRYIESTGDSVYEFISPKRIALVSVRGLYDQSNLDLETEVQNIIEDTKKRGEEVLKSEVFTINKEEFYYIQILYANSNNISTIQDYYLIKKDNSIYVFSFISSELIYQDASKIFEDILKTIEIIVR